MVVFVAEVIKRDEASGASRYRIERGAKAFGAWSRRARSARAGVRLSESERAADAVARLTESAENFERVQAWMEGRQDRLVDVRPSLPSREGPLGRTYTLRLPTVTNGSTTDEATRAEWEDLACSCLVTFRHDAGCGTVSYFGCVSTHEASPSVYSVDLVIPDAFERLAATVPSLGVLLGRIRGWLCPA